MTQIIARNLPVNTSYTLINSWTEDEGEYLQCQNCGRVIKNICQVKSAEGNLYIVGTECMDRLTGILPSEIAEVKRKLRIEKTIKKRISQAENPHAYIWKNTVWIYPNTEEDMRELIAKCGIQVYREKFAKYIKSETQEE